MVWIAMHLGELDEAEEYASPGADHLRGDREPE